MKMAIYHLMRLIGLTSIAILLYVWLIFGSKFADTIYFTNKVKNEWSALQIRVNVLESEGVSTNQVEWLIKENIHKTVNQKEHDKNLTTLKKCIEAVMEYNFQVIPTEEETTQKYILNQKDTFGESTYTLLSYKQGDIYLTDLVYYYKNINETSLLHKNHMEKINKETSGFFRSEYTIFACIEGYSNDKLVKALWKKMNHVMKKLDAQKIESVDEGTFVSIAAYTDHWEGTFSSAEKKMNMQIAFRVGDKKTKWFFGTPIILSEYE